MNVRPVLNGLWRWIKKNSTKLLAGGAITAEIFGFWFMHKEAPIVRKRLDELPESATLWDKVKTAVPVYIPAIIMLMSSTGCIIGGCALGDKKAAVIASLYSASEASLRRMGEKVVKELGPEKAKELHDEAIKELSEENPPKPTNVKNTGKGTDLFFERMTGQWILSSYAAVQKDEAFFNKMLMSEPGKGLEFNEWLMCLGGEAAEFGDMVGFDADHTLDLIITGDCRTEDGQLYYILDYASGSTYGPVMYNGKKGIEFRRRDDCFIDEC